MYNISVILLLIRFMIENGFIYELFEKFHELVDDFTDYILNETTIIEDFLSGLECLMPEYFEDDYE